MFKVTSLLQVVFRINETDCYVLRSDASGQEHFKRMRLAVAPSWDLNPSHDSNIGLLRFKQDDAR